MALSCDHKATASLTQSSEKRIQKQQFLIGPEGGLTDLEIIDSD